jgi:hypothetical protein
VESDGAPRENSGSATMRISFAGCLQPSVFWRAECTSHE